MTRPCPLDHIKANLEIYIRQGSDRWQAYCRFVPHCQVIDTIMPSKNDYEPIPDVSNDGGGKSLYEDLPTDQAALIQNMDAAISTANFNFEMPKADPKDLQSQGASYIQSIVQPTLTSLVTLAGGWIVSGQAQYSTFAAVVTTAFPYINSVIVFLSSAKPLSTRCSDAVKPIFDKTDKVQDDITDKVGDITKQVDVTIDTIQEQVQDVLKPMKPTIDEAASKDAMLRKINPDFDIPDTKDIDDEFDELQGKVGSKIEEAQKHLDFDKHVPYPFQSHSNFYWSIIVPVLVVALLCQLGVAFATTYASQQQQLAVDETTTRQRYLRGRSNNILNDVHQQMSNYPLLEMDIAAATTSGLRSRRHLIEAGSVAVEDVQDGATEAIDGVKAGASAQVDAAKEEVSAQADAVKEEASAKLDATKDEASAQFSDAKAKASAKMNAAKDAVTEQVDAAKQQATEQLDAAKEQAQQAKDEAAAQTDSAKEQATEQLDAAKEKAEKAKEDALKQAKELEDQMMAQKEEYEQQLKDYQDQLPTIIMSVVSSYLMSLLQMGLLFLFTSPKVKAWIINMFMKKVSSEADKTLREYGVTTTVEDVMGTRMSRIRKKLLKLFNTVGKLQGLLDKIPNVDIPGVGNAKEAVGDMMGKVKSGKASKKLSKKLGKFF